MTFSTLTADVDLNLTDVATLTMILEMQSRGLCIGVEITNIMKMCDAFKIGNDEEAVEIAKRLCETVTGKMHP